MAYTGQNPKQNTFYMYICKMIRKIVTHKNCTTKVLHSLYVLGAFINKYNRPQVKLLKISTLFHPPIKEHFVRFLHGFSIVFY